MGCLYFSRSVKDVYLIGTLDRIIHNIPMSKAGRMTWQTVNQGVRFRTIMFLQHRALKCLHVLFPLSARLMLAYLMTCRGK